MKIGLMGSHGVGKTSLCLQLTAELKSRGVDVEMVREIARACPLPINQETSVQAQEWILHTQIAEELVASQQHDVVVCDRSLLDHYCYLVQIAGSQRVWETLLDTWLPTYGLLVHVPVISPPRFDGVRVIDPRFQEEIDLMLDGMITARGLRPLRLSEHLKETWIETIVTRLLPVVEPTLPLFTDSA